MMLISRDVCVRKGLAGSVVTQGMHRALANVLLIVLAVMVSVTAMAMAGVAAWDRGATRLDSLLLLALSISIVLGTHLIPSLTRRKTALVLWMGCLLCAVYSHMTFLTIASNRAGDLRAQNSIHVQGFKQQIDAVTSALNGITARPVTQVARDLANADNYRLRVSLKAELGESRRAAKLRDELVRLQGLVTTAQDTDNTDPVTLLLASVTNKTESELNFVIWLGFSVLLELLGVLLWIEVTSRSGGLLKVDSLNQSKSDLYLSLQNAIKAGKCKPTVAGIRSYLRCGQSQAMTLRRLIDQ